MAAKTEASDLKLNNPPESGRRKDFASVIILDLESTGLKNNPKITELCMISVQTDELKAGTYPRVVNKLQLCFNPQKIVSIEASQMTGLYNDALEHMGLFKDQLPIISSFLATQPQPACMIAHNGLYFDFPLLQAELCRANLTLTDGLDIWCADSLQGVRVLDGLPPVPELYRKKQDDNGNNSEKFASTSTRPHNPATSGDSGGSGSCSKGKEITPTKRAAESGDELSGTKLVKKDSSETPPSMDKKQIPETDELVDELESKTGRVYAKRERLLQRLACGSQGETAAENAGVTSPTLEEPSEEVLTLQGSISDSQIAEAYDSIMSEKQADLVDTHKVNTLQQKLETTPTKDEKQTAGTLEKTADQFVKQNQESAADIRSRERFTAKRNRLAKRLFGGSKQSEDKPLNLPSAQYTSYKLMEIYKRDYGSYPEVCHTAAGDCVTLLKIIMKRRAQFMSYVEENAVLLSSVEPMYYCSPAATNNNGND